MIVYSYATDKDIFMNIEHANSINGDIWITLPKETKVGLLLGFHKGVETAANKATMMTQRKYAPKSEESFKKVMLKDSQHSKNFEEAKIIISDIMDEESISYEPNKVIEQMDYLYKDPSVRIIPWFLICNLAQRRLDGKDINKSVNMYIKYKPWVLKL